MTPSPPIDADGPRVPPAAVLALAGLGGVAALSWEVLWQLRASLALGASAQATAITLAAAMAGMAAGSLAAGHWLRGRALRGPLRVYGALELAVGCAGLATPAGFRVLERLDGALWAAHPTLAPAAQALGIALLIGPGAFAMGASVPVFARVAAAHGSSLAALYGANTLGAAAGVLLFAFVFVPWLGLARGGALVAAINAAVCAAALALERRPREAPAPVAPPPRLPPAAAAAIVFATGFASFALEVAWFRALRAAFLSSADSFALMLFAVLVGLGAGAQLAPALRRRGVAPGWLLGAAAVAILLATPLVERMDELAAIDGSYAELVLGRAGLALAALGPAMLLLGTALPWLLEEYRERGGAGWLYATNTAGSVAGSLCATWLLLPTLGFARSAWAIGGAIALGAAAALPRRRALVVLAPAALALAVAVVTTEEIGRRRILGTWAFPSLEILAFEEGAEATASVVEGPIAATGASTRALVIDGFVATAEDAPGTSYMAWMGRLPMLLHPHPERALVICFGTGQTANAVLEEGPARLDVVELNPAVLRMAPLFASNHGVLDDPRVRAIAMDGRAWLRRTGERYDVVTLEPMPPSFAGVNALYSREFYEIVASRLAPGGIAAQWVPLHLLPPFYAASIAATFQAAFPDAILWQSEDTGILLGRREAAAEPLGRAWPGLERPAERRPEAAAHVRGRIALDSEQLARWVARGRIVRDDNQLLAYGAIHRQFWTLGGDLAAANGLALRESLRGEVPGLRARPVRGGSFDETRGSRGPGTSRGLAPH